MIRLFVTQWYYIINIILVEKNPIIKSNKQNLYSEFPLVSTKYIKIDKIRVVANKITLFYHNKAPSEFIVTFQAPFFIRATSENYEPNYEALQVEYCWNHWYFSLSSLCKSYAPKKYYPSANGECGVYIVERRGLDWQFWLMADMVKALSATGSPTTQRGLRQWESVNVDRKTSVSTFLTCF